MIRRIFFTIVTILLSSTYINAQIGTDFWFAGPDLESQHAQTPIYFCITSYDEPATVTFTQPANSSYQPQTFTLQANSFHQYDISSIVDIVETKPCNTIVNYGFHITSTSPVSIYYESNNNNSEIYTLKGNNALGLDFIVASQSTYNNNYSTTCNRAEFVAVYDDTEITIVPNVALKGGIAAGQTVTVTLNRGQSYAIEAASPSAAGHLRGTRITSNKPIAVNTSDDSVVQGSNYDLVGDQLVPVNMLGTNYLAVKTSSATDHLYFYPTEENTKIYINGNTTPVATLSPGNDYHYTMSEAVTNITSDKPISVFQLTATTSNEMGGTVLPQIRCTGSNKVAYRRPTIDGDSPMIVTIITETEYTDGFVLNDNANVITAASFTPVPSKPEYSYCKQTVSNYVPVGQVMRLSNTHENGYFQLGVFSGSSGTCTYGFFSDYQEFSRVELLVDTTEYCPGSQIEFDYNGTNVADVVLITPNGQTISNFPYIIEDATEENSGYYYVRGIDETGCFEGYVQDSVNITVFAQVPETHIDAEICTGQSYHEHGFNFDNPSPGTYTDQQNLLSVHGCDSIVTLELVVNDVLENHINDAICYGQDYNRYGFYFENPSMGLHYDTLITQTAAGCDSIVMLELTVNDVLEKNISDVICFGEDYDRYGFYLEQPSSGLHYDTLVRQTAFGCDSIVMLELLVGEVFENQYFDTICKGEEYHEHGFDLKDLDVGLYNKTLELSTVLNCDSTINLSLYVASTFSKIEYDSICYGENYTEHGLNIYKPNPGIHDYTSILESIIGCDSIIYVTLKVNTTLPEPDTLYGIKNVYVQSDIFTGKYNYWIDPIEGCDDDDYEWSLENDDWIITPNGNKCEVIVTKAITNRLTVSIKNYCGTTEKFVDITAGYYDIDEHNSIDVSIYPNPANDIINISCKNIDKVNIYNTSGQIVWSNDFEMDDNVTIDVSGLMNSVYILEIITKDGRCIKQFSKAQ